MLSPPAAVKSPRLTQMAADKNVNNHELLSPPAAGMSPKSNKMAADKNVNNHELILGFVCCHHKLSEIDR